MRWQPAKWIFYAPVAVLPWLAAITLNREPAGESIFTGNWVWLLVALGLGAWFGWATTVKEDMAP